ncbi:MAG: L-lactate dehydrogenase [Thermoflexales bacterium]|nr:L-lactate dehydrogenase [Thermoflexales bacterium]
MKIGIIGSGMVGSTAAYAMVMRGVGREIVLVDRNAERAKAEADDILHAVPFAHPIQVSAGDYPNLAGCHVVVITAGTAQKPGETRLQLLERNAAILQGIVSQIIKHAPEAVLVVVTNPVDVMTYLTARYAEGLGVPETRVIGSGTMLDTARFRALLGRHLGVDSQHVHAYVVGEHGDSEVLTWSLAAVGGIPLEDFCELQKINLDEATRQEIDRQVRQAAYSIIAGKGATYYGIGSTLARIVDVILRDQRAVLTVSTRVVEIAGVCDVSISLPHLIGGAGVLADLPVPLAPGEEALLRASADVVCQAIREFDKAA